MSPSPLRISAEKLDLSPERRVPLAGFSGCERLGEPGEPLEGTLIRLSDGSTDLILGSFDLLYVGSVLRSAVLEVTRGAIADDHVVLGASHTHYAPATDPTKPELGQVDAPYLSWATRVVTRGVGRLLERPMEPVASVETAVTTLRHSVNRRLKRVRLSRRGLERQVVMAPNSRGPKDERATSLLISSARGPVALLWSYASHPTSSPSPNLVTSEYPGQVRRRLREELRMASLPVAFLQGFSGDIRPDLRGSLRNGVDLARRVAHGPSFARPEPAVYREWTNSMADRVAGSLSRRRPSGTELSFGSLSLPNSRLYQGATADQFRLIRFNIGDVQFIGGSAEFVTEYTGVTNAVGPGRHVVPIGCLDHVTGYLPTSEMLHQGGYEVEGFCEAFNLDSVRPEAPDLVSGLMQQLYAPSVTPPKTDL